MGKKDNYSYDDSFNDMDAFYEEMVKEGYASNLDVSDITFERKKKDKHKKENSGRSFFDDKKSKHYEKNEWKRTFEKAGENIEANKIKVIGNIYDNKEREVVEEAPRKTVERAEKIKSPSQENFLCKFKVRGNYKRYIFDDNVSPVSGSCIVRNTQITELAKNISKEDWLKDIRSIFIKYILSTRYPAAIYTLEEFAEAFGDFKGYISSADRKIWFVPYILTEEYIGLYIILMSSADVFDNCVLEWCNGGEWSGKIILTDWIQLMETSSTISSKFICNEDLISDIHDSTANNRKNITKYIYDTFSNEDGFTYEEISDNIVTVEDVKEAIIETVETLVPGYPFLAFDNDDEEDEENEEALETPSEKIEDENDDDIAEIEKEESDEDSEEAVSALEKIIREKKKIIEDLEASKIKYEFDNTEVEKDDEEVYDSSDDDNYESSFDDDIDSLIDKAMQEIPEEEPESEPVKIIPAKEEKIEKPKDEKGDGKKEVFSSSSIVIQQNDSDDPDSIVIKPVRRKG